MIKTIAVIVAMTSELEQVKSLLADTQDVEAGPFNCITGKLNGNTIVLMQCGIGKVNAAAGATELINRFHPDTIVSTGVAGGLGDNVRVMDVVVARSCTYHDMWCGPGCVRGEIQGITRDGFTCDNTLLRTAMALPTEVRIHPGLIITGDCFITDRAEQGELRTAFPEAMAVDMESCAIAHVAYLYKVPFISFRIISDTPGSDGHQQQYEGFWQSMVSNSFTVTRLFLDGLTNLDH